LANGNDELANKRDGRGEGSIVTKVRRREKGVNPGEWERNGAHQQRLKFRI